MHPNAENIQPGEISGERALRVTNVFRDALEAKKGPVCNLLDLPHEKALIKEALLRLIRESDDIDAKAEFTMMYLALAEFQDQGTARDHDRCNRAMVEESEKLLTDLRGLERSH